MEAQGPSRAGTAALAPPSGGDAAGRWDWYERLRGLGEVVWDPGRNAWLVLSHRAAKELSRGEGEAFLSAMAFRRETFLGMDWDTYVWYQGGPRRVNLLTGDEHARMHRWWMAAFSPRVVSAWRENVIRPVVAAQLDRCAGDGRADLGRLADGVHLRVIAGTVGMPWDDDAWLDRWEQITRDNQRVKHYMPEPEVPAEVVERALAAAGEMREELLRWVRRHREGGDDYLISMMWRDFPGLLGEVDEGDVLANLKPAFETNSTRAAIRNALYAVASQPAARDALLAGSLDVGRFVEETFRLYSGFGPPRIALRDVELGGASISRGEMVVALVGAVNTDPGRFGCPHDIDTARDGPRDHFLFNQGPRACPGQNLGRAELEETVLGVLHRLPGLRLDPDAPPPRYEVAGNDARWDPLNVLFDPA